MCFHLAHLGSPRHVQEQMFLGADQHTRDCCAHLVCRALVSQLDLNQYHRMFPWFIESFISIN